jgi:hypothetical protein
MKRQTTRTNAWRSRAAVDKAWFECWYKKLSQNRIQKWIERISRHIQRVIELNESNEYWEDREDDENDENDIHSYDSNDGRTRYLKNKRAFDDDNDDDAKNDEMSEIINFNDFSDDDEWFFRNTNFDEII